ncbi:MAG: right-handed parallel beta-helix repeat-containing protein [Candidatus Heimdallarchaeum endolithica]|uniref:Probable pectate lyase C n=1 Tax=Candidatus Heimdallarchaeum endolithica TaxID=2876572 RepID=A0A9Y1BRS3_9ARCH|nr:MAG: right-handed parallel beta-helix repeat-containing protein [Candidatus Heimdallarchaeum endolithica]
MIRFNKNLVRSILLLMLVVLIIRTSNPNKRISSNQDVLGFINDDTFPSYQLTDYVNTSILLDNDIVIQDGEECYIYNSILSFNLTDNGQYSIHVESGGHLYINNSTIKSIDPTLKYVIIAEKGSEIRIENSYLSDLGYRTSDFTKLTHGLVIQTDSALIRNTTFTNYFIAIRLYSSEVLSGITITNNSFISDGNNNEYYAAIRVDCSVDRLFITNNVFTAYSYSYSGLKLGSGTNCVISSNTFNNFGDAISLFGNLQDSQVSYNYIYDGRWSIEIWDGNNISIFGNKLYRNSCGFEIYGGSNLYLHENELFNETIRVFGGDFTNFNSINNKVNGKDIRFVLSQKDVLIESTTIEGELVLINSENVILKDFTCPISVYQSNNITLTDSIIKDGDVGVSVSETSKLKITSSIISGNSWGIIAWGNNLFIENCSFMKNGYTFRGVPFGYGFSKLKQLRISNSSFSDDNLNFPSSLEHALILGCNFINSNIVVNYPNATFLLNNFYNTKFTFYSSNSYFDNGIYGNYWNETTVIDSNGDLINDSSYSVSDNINDNFPLTIPTTYYKDYIYYAFSKSLGFPSYFSVKVLLLYDFYQIDSVIVNCVVDSFYNEKLVLDYDNITDTYKGTIDNGDIQNITISIEYSILPLDSDSDGLTDANEILIYDTDPYISDSDGDGYNDFEEVVSNTDPLDSTSNPESQQYTQDTDSDGLTDGDEVNTYGTDPLVSDTDSDGLTDGDEVNTCGTDPLVSDSDGDGMLDGWEVDNSLDPLTDDSSLDPDIDGLTNLEEYQAGTDPNNSDTDSDCLTDGDEVNTYGTDPLVSDTDSDCLTDGDEVNTYGTDPLVSDTDSDCLTDGDEVNTYGTDPLVSDTDSDCLTDGDEVNTYGTDPLVSDTDSDGLTDGDEVNTYGTDPTNSDSDSDGMPDGWEIEFSLDPLVDDSAEDPDSDGLTNLEEYQNNTDPLVSDTDGDGYSDGDEVNKGTDPTDSSNYPTTDTTENLTSNSSSSALFSLDFSSFVVFLSVLMIPVFIRLTSYYRRKQN